jgi:hypothetical protein
MLLIKIDFEIVNPFQWVDTEASLSKDALNALQTDFESCMGNRMSPSNSSKLLSRYFQLILSQLFPKVE